MHTPYIPYFQTSRYRVETMVELAQVKPAELAADLGSGDGRIVIAFAKAGIDTVGFELDEKLAELSEENIQKEHVKNKAHILQKDFWEENLSRYAIITVYPMPDIMELLEKKLLTELKPGTRVLLNYYPFPEWNFFAKKDNIYLYVR